MNKNILKFFYLTFIFTWLLWLPTVLHAQWQKMPSILLALGLFAGFMPSAVGLVMLKIEHGPEFRQYMKKRMTLSFPKKWLLIMMIFPLQAALSLYLTKIIDSNFQVVNPVNPLMLPFIFLQILFIGGAIGEEFGWRGYAFEKMQLALGAIKATLFLGIIWSLWHLPLFFMLNTAQSNFPIWQFMLQNTLLTFFYTWIFNKTNGNIILMLLLHAIMNTSSAFFPYWQSNTGRYVGFFLMIIMLIVISFKYKWQSK